MVKDTDLPDALPIGVVNMGQASLAQWNTILPEFAIGQIADIWEDKEHWWRVMDKIVWERHDAQLQSINTKLICLLSAG
jgi:TRAP-type C4-dicarboxylate transport system substrate-binding protein